VSNTDKKSNEPDVDTFITENSHYVNDLNRNPCDIEDQHNHRNVYGSLDFFIKRLLWRIVGFPWFNWFLRLKTKKIITEYFFKLRHGYYKLGIRGTGDGSLVYPTSVIYTNLTNQFRKKNSLNSVNIFWEVSKKVLVLAGTYRGEIGRQIHPTASENFLQLAQVLKKIPENPILEKFLTTLWAGFLCIPLSQPPDYAPSVRVYPRDKGRYSCIPRNTALGTRISKIPTTNVIYCCWFTDYLPNLNLNHHKLWQLNKWRILWT